MDELPGTTAIWCFFSMWTHSEIVSCLYLSVWSNNWHHCSLILCFSSCRLWFWTMRCNINGFVFASLHTHRGLYCIVWDVVVRRHDGAVVCFCLCYLSSVGNMLARPVPLPISSSIQHVFIPPLIPNDLIYGFPGFGAVKCLLFPIWSSVSWVLHCPELHTLHSLSNTAQHRCTL